MKPAQYLKIILIPVTASLFLAGCQTAIAPLAFEELYQGYPCDGTCDQFERGFVSAQQQQFVNDESCDKLPQTQRLGCLTYLHEYRLEHDQPPGYTFD